MYDVNRFCTFGDVGYKVISVLSNDLLLVVSVRDYEDKKFPLQTYIIPDEQIIEQRKNMRQEETAR